MAGPPRIFTLAIPINLINIVVMKQFWTAVMNHQTLAKRLTFGKKLTPNQVDLIVHAAILAASFAAVALAAALGGSY